MCGAGEKTSRDDKSGLVGQPLNVELYEKKLKPAVGGRSRKTGRRLHVSWKRYVERAFPATTVHGRRRATFEQRFAVTTNDALKTAASSPLSRDTAWRRAARALQQSLPAVSRSYVLLMRKIATRVNLQLDCENVKRHTCKRCGSIFQPGRNTFVRVRRQRLVLHCKICGAFRRFPIKFVASGSVAPAIPNVVRSVPVRDEENTPFSPTSATAVTRDER
jgi:RNase P subunit RPR2